MFWFLKISVDTYGRSLMDAIEITGRQECPEVPSDQ